MYEIARSKGVLDGPHCETYCCNFVNEDMQLPPTAKKYYVLNGLQQYLFCVQKFIDHDQGRRIN